MSDFSAPNAEQQLEQLLERARRVLPQDWPFGSVWAIGHADGAYPHFAERAEGARFWDVTGREYIDWFLGGGVVTLGHRHPAVQRAMAEQLARGVYPSLPTGLEVEVGERLCAMIPGAEQAAFGKNGTDVTSAAVRLARSLTGREHVLISGYHGWQDWSKAVSPDCVGIPSVLRTLVHEFPYNDVSAAQRLIQQCDGGVAAIVVEPLRYAPLRREFLPGLRALADAHGCLLVFDEIVTGFRVARGGVQQLAAVRADLTCLAKSLANGLPLAALVGPRRFMQHLPPTFFALTYQREALSLAAARASLDVYQTEDVAGHLADIGERLRAGFAAAASAAGLDWALEGHPAMLHIRLSGGGRLHAAGSEALFVECCQRAGVYVQMHRLLPSLAHTAADVDTTVAVMADAMQVVKTAMEAGLEGRFDSPIWSEHQRPPLTAPAVSAEARADICACPFITVPPNTCAGRIVPFKAPPEATCAVAVDDRRVLLQLEGAGPIRCGVELVAAVDPGFAVRARYRVTRSPGIDARCAIVLAGCGARDGAWFDVRHLMFRGQSSWSSASLGGRFSRQPSPYGESAGTLELRFLDEETTAWHEIQEAVRVGVGEAARQPLRIRFQVELVSVSGSVAVELVDLAFC